MALRDLPDEATVPFDGAGLPVAERRARIVVPGAGKDRKSLPLPSRPGDEVVIGKADDCDLRIADPSVSRRHCAIRREADGWIVRDLGSTNGTFLGEARIRESYLHPGAELRAGNVTLRVEGEHVPVALAPSANDRFGPLRGGSVKMREIFTLLERVRDSDAAVLITGETGTGKGAVARAIHEESRRASRPLVIVDCGAVAPTLIESELFGHERGAFTGASERRVGALEAAQGGTLFFDEFDDLRKDLQPKLLRALEERTFRRVGSQQPLRFDARVIAASKKDVRSLVAKGVVRDDLYFRLAVFRVDLPPLRGRKEDLPQLVDHFASALGAGEGSWARLPRSVRERLGAHDWPGNLRELRNTIDRAWALGGGRLDDEPAWQMERGLLAPGDPLDVDFRRPYREVKTVLLERLEREYLTRLLARTGGNIAQAAREAQLARRHLYTLLEKHGLRAGGPLPDDDAGPDDGEIG